MSSSKLAQSSASPDNIPLRLALIGAGTIGLSFAALHLLCATTSRPLSLTIYDTRTDLIDYVRSNLPEYFEDQGTSGTGDSGEKRESQSASSKHVWFEQLLQSGRLRLIRDSLEMAVQEADIVQEQGPENLPFKRNIWKEVERLAPPECLFWSSTSGITVTEQSQDMEDKTRLVVVHPYNPPHVMPLLEVVPSPHTDPDVVQKTVAYWQSIGREPIVLHKEVTGFIANRLAFTLLRESIHLVQSGVVSVADLDTVVQTSMGPRWAVAGPFKSYHMGGGVGGLRAFMNNIGGTVQACWDDAGKENVVDGLEDVYKQTEEAYGAQLRKQDVVDRDRITKEVLKAARGRSRSL